MAGSALIQHPLWRDAGGGGGGGGGGARARTWGGGGVTLKPLPILSMDSQPSLHTQKSRVNKASYKVATHQRYNGLAWQHH